MLHQGLAELTGLTIGVVSIIVGAAVLLLWIPLRQRPGLGTVSNVFVVGIAMDGTLALVPDAHALAARIPAAAGGRRAERRGDGPVHHGVLRGRPPGRADDRTAPPHRPFGPAGAHRPGGGGRRDRLRPGRHRRHGHGAVRRRDRAARPALPARVRRPPGTARRHRGNRPVRTRGRRYCPDEHPRHATRTSTTPARSPSPTGAVRRTAWRTRRPSSVGRWTPGTATSRPTCTPRRTAGWSPSTTPPSTG